MLGDDKVDFSSLNLYPWQEKLEIENELKPEENALIALRIFLASRNLHKVVFFGFSSI